MNARRCAFSGCHDTAAQQIAVLIDGQILGAPHVCAPHAHFCITHLGYTPIRTITTGGLL